jgi:multiple sugar transport system permease protein
MAIMPTHIDEIEPQPQSRQAGENREHIIGYRTFAPKNIMALVFLGGMTIYFLTPLYWLAIAATKNNTDLFASAGLWLAHFNLFTNLSELFTHQNGVYGRWLLNTVLYAVVGGAISTFISVMAGYALAKYRFRGNGLVFSLVLGGALVPLTTLALPIYLAESKYGIANSYWAVLLPSLLSPFGVFLARVYAIASIPDDLIAAARVDGARELRIFWSVSLPILLPGMVTIFLFQFAAIWNNFLLPLIVLNNPDYYPVNLGLATWNFDPASHEIIYNLIVTGSLVAVVPLIVMFIILQRYWRTGLSFGSVTG